MTDQNANTPYQALLASVQALLAALADPEKQNEIVRAMLKQDTPPEIQALQAAVARNKPGETVPTYIAINDAWGPTGDQYYALPGDDPVAYESLADAIDVTNRLAIEEDNPDIRLYELVPVDDPRLLNPYKHGICLECDCIVPLEDAARDGDDFYCKAHAPEGK